MKLLLHVLLLALAGTNAVLADTYPAKSIRVMVGATAGGGSDIVARLIAAKLSDRLGKSVVVENRPGAGGNIANDVVAKAPPDGYTLGMAYSGLAINPVVMSPMPFDTLRDLAPVSQVAMVQYLLVVDAKTQIASVRDLIDQAKANPGRLAFGVNALASVGHLSTELFKMRTGVDMPTVVYKGSSQALVDLLGGRVTAMFDTVAASSTHIKNGKLRAIAVGGDVRSSMFPEVPTMKEAGLPELEVHSWYGVVAPAGTPPEIVNRLSKEIAEIVQTPEIRDRFAAQALEPVGNSPADFARFIRSEMQSWDAVAKAARIKID